jgi:hypothetical protein
MKLQEEIAHTLKYFDYFHYPLKNSEIHRWLRYPITFADLNSTLDSEVEEGRVKAHDGFFGLGNIVENIENRNRDEESYARLKPEIERSARIISGFPFVRMVAISGTASKGVMPEGSDYDFFILTAPKKMWIARTLLHLFKKLTFLVGKQHNFCMNYFKDETVLQIAEQSPFTAIELLTLIPVCGHDRYDELLKSNEWYLDLFPNAWSSTENIHVQPSAVKGLVEIILWPISGPILNRFFMKWTYRKWRKKWRKRGYDMKEFDRSFKSSLVESKNHPDNMARQLELYLNE